MAKPTVDPYSRRYVAHGLLLTRYLCDLTRLYGGCGECGAGIRVTRAVLGRLWERAERSTPTGR